MATNGSKKSLIAALYLGLANLLFFLNIASLPLGAERAEPKTMIRSTLALCNRAPILLYHVAKQKKIAASDHGVNFLTW
jgi:hypothetical protein